MVRVVNGEMNGGHGYQACRENQLKGSKIGRSFKNTNAASDQAKGGRWGATLLFIIPLLAPLWALNNFTGNFRRVYMLPPIKNGPTLAI